MAVAEEEIVGKLQKLPRVQRQEVLDFIEFLAQRNSVRPARRSLKGALSHLNIRFTRQDLEEARQEMWPGYLAEDD
jgi:Protein of unknown function (DUF2281)